jgi:hypothetical protein
MEPIISPGTGTPVKPIANNFIRLMPQTPQVTFSNYATHGVPPLQGKGYCLDIMVSNSSPDTGSGFYNKETAMQVIHNIAHAAAKAGGDWAICYNDVSIATEAAKFYGNRITYSGVGEKTPATNWHGPLNLHFHLDIVPHKDIQKGEQSPAGKQGPAE